ncbi:cytochrome-c oxidase, cbb3-type subunit III [Cochlodiniinecator piscidefendens]|uniref:cytochrome-c oxidase, cbb3-type subunit III n=1 Tax=Cochlodiniinecator piscidefendens TaxID=2715756 RepID=UPI00140A84FA|nr:cytochrome-c oxidase, cbb3-type subunit III [Cochlodiniinecator piscidefendens]
MSKKPVEQQDPETTGHSWDGIEEFNNPLPRWWLYTLYACIVWGIGYMIAYPAWPLINGATPGLLGYSTRAEVQTEIEAFDARNAEIEATLVATPLDAVPEDENLNRFAINAGGSVFRTWCAQCHGSGAAGATGYPNLLDNDWLWGGSIDEIYATVNHGIRNEEDLDARFSQMPAFGDFLEDTEVDQIVNHVMAISGQESDPVLAAAGSDLFLDNCASCHADDGTGDRFQGAPNLTDAIWLYGGNAEALRETVTNARFGVMPSWGGRLSEADVRAVSIYVHQLGGGE